MADDVVAALTAHTTGASQSDYQSRATTDADPEERPSLGGAFSQSSMTTACVYSVNQGTETVGSM